jgi:hypothetical protein
MEDRQRRAHENNSVPRNGIAGRLNLGVRLQRVPQTATIFNIQVLTPVLIPAEKWIAAILMGRQETNGTKKLRSQKGH